MLKSLFRRTKTSRADEIYVSLVARARHEDFYSAGIVPDTFDGRFEMMVMHLYLVHSRLKDASEAGRQFSQELFDAFIADMDAGLREAGVGDQTVPKRINKMTRVFYGRTGAYDEIFDDVTDTTTKLEATISRNLFPDDDEGDVAAQSKTLSNYMMHERSLLKAMSEQDIAQKASLFSGAPTLDAKGAN